MGKDAKSSANSLLQDMETLSELLETYHFKENNRIELTGLVNAVNTIRSNMGAKKRSLIKFTTGTEGITFHSYASGMNSNPGLLNNKIDLTLTLTYEYDCDKTLLKDIINCYILDIQIEGTHKNVHGQNSNHYFEWLQNVTLPKKKDDDKYRFIHPRYHFHAGGAFLKEKAPGSLIQLNCPRIPHPPMDIILAVNFIICNFFSTQESKLKKEMKILDDDDYKTIVSRAAKRLYSPYFEEIQSDITQSEFMPLFTT